MGLPEAFTDRIRNQSYIDNDGLVRSFDKPSPVSVRINPAKWSLPPAALETVPWCRYGLYLQERPSFTLDPLFHAGCYYPQEASSMFLEQVYLQTSAEINNIRVLDLCGAPGGKSTHLSTLVGKNGFIVSNEVIRQRAMVLTENLTKWGLSNSIVTQSDPSAFSGLPGFFDLIVVDAPCSGEGMFRDPVAIKEWSEENAALCSVRQKRILMDVWPALKENGILIYSTCTFNPDENEKNIKWLTERQLAEPVRINITGFNEIIEIDHEGIYGYGFYPYKVKGEGLFIAVLRKKENNARRSFKKMAIYEQKISREEKAVSLEWTGLNDARMFKSGMDLFAAPCDYSDLTVISETLKLVSPGTRIITAKRNDFLPSHDLAMSILLKKEIFPSIDLSLHDALLYLKRENFNLKLSDKGWNLVRYRGVNLGFVNNIGSRFNNYYPVEWRIRMALPEIIPPDFAATINK
jgi:16S rRNA C967 or C1407 C5-methylase (RsmB/RsmF family)/NOL1/NOP2/fmu family ribosome biogenesis protein